MDSADESVLSSFSSLDELIQLIYQGSHKFVVMSSVNDMNWTIHLGLTTPEARWWVGKWSEKDVVKFVGSSTSSVLLESFAERLAQTVVQGELYVGNWSSAKGADINLTLGPSAKTPVSIPLTEMSVEETLEYSTKVFAEIALQAQSRKCRLHPSSYEISHPPPTTSHTSPTRPSAHSKGKRKAEEADLPPVKGHSTLKKPSEEELKAQAKIRELEAELAQQRKKAQESEKIANNATTNLQSKAKTAPSAVKPVKGASLANPNKKARKYQALEFESDED